jgi:hypothetical protein
MSKFMSNGAKKYIALFNSAKEPEHYRKVSR